MTKYNETKMDKNLRSGKLRTENKKQTVFDSEGRRTRSRLSSTVKVGATCASEFDTRRGAALYVV